MFFDVTKSLLYRIIDSIQAAVNTFIPVVGSVSVVFVAIITIGLIESKSKKKYINDNFILIIVLICVETFISLFSNEIFAKVNLFTIVACLFFMIYKTKRKKRTSKKTILKEGEENAKF